MKDIKDYLPFYLGCEVMLHTYLNPCNFIGIEEEDAICLNSSGRHVVKMRNIKPILRPLPDITDEEQNEFIEVCGLEPEDIDCIKKHPSSFVDGHMVFGTAHLTNILQWSIGTNWLRKKGFDIDNLIESGLAIDKTKIAQPA